MARWPSSAKWGEAPALDGQRAMPLALRLSEGLGIGANCQKSWDLLKALLCVEFPRVAARLL